ncbi:MAG: phospholipid carrier-dependent glycosyltransferase [Acidimicrobiia bacterium]
MVTGAGGALRFFRLGAPNRIYFDEYFYAKQAGQYVVEGVEFRGAVHPPLGKWAIAAGIELWGYTPFGWRFASAVAGTVTIALVYVTGRLLFERRSIAALGAALVAVEGVAFTMSRIAMLDIFVGLFVVLGFLFVVLDKRCADRAEPRSYRWWWAIGAAFGMGAAVKWSALSAFAIGVGFIAVTEILRRRRGGQIAWRKAIATALAAFVILPLVIYLASFASWFINFDKTRPGKYLCAVEQNCDPSIADRFEWFVRDQENDAQFHTRLRTKHPYAARAWKWPLLTRPVRFGRATCPSELLESLGRCITSPGHVRLWLSQGNPAIWWTAIPATGLVAVVGFRRRDWRALLLVSFVLLQWLPWVVSARKTYLFYATPLVPFICLVVAFATGWLTVRWQKRWLPAFVALVAVGMFAFFYPVYSGVELPFNAVEQRLWFDAWH